MLAQDQIAILVAVILESATAGGMSEEQADVIYSLIMSNICNLEDDPFDMLLDDLIERWALPIVKGRYTQC